MSFSLHPEVDREMEQAAIWYDRRYSALGSDFLAELRDAFRKIQTTPQLFSPAEDAPSGKEIRALVLRRFPFRVVYYLSGNDIIIVAVAHLRKRPGYWHKRV